MGKNTGKKILLLGHTGKIGSALSSIFEGSYHIVRKGSKDFNALDFARVRDLVDESNPDILINGVAFLGIDSCEKEPEKALRLNALYPKLLAELSNEKGFLLVHFSTDAVFDDRKEGFYTESDCPHPLNMYGFTKYGGDCFIQAIARCYYIFRMSVLFGETKKNTQFVEKMLQNVREGQKDLRVFDDVVLSPTYSKDVAREIRRILESSCQSGLYHIANAGKGSLYDLMKEIVEGLALDVKVKKASYRDFPFIGIKNTYTPIKSEKIAPLRPWREAVKEYCLKKRERE